MIAWVLATGIGLVLLGVAVRAIVRITRGPRISADDARIAALQLRVDMLESDLHAVDTGLEHLKARTEFAERLAQSQDA
ncbi:MAG: hypothetical protein KF709_12980 [Gemmatimonadaceae bacterium]|nr:hypothetical protein [Gemmatimonadaceae bacterium]